MEGKEMTIKDKRVELFNRYWDVVRHAREQGKKIVFSSIPAPYEFVMPMDMVVVLPSNVSASCSTWKLGTEMCERSEVEGYSQDLCSYARTDIGSTLLGEKTKSPFGVMPKPDLLLTTTGQDHNVMKWFEIYKRMYKVPLIWVDIPFIHDNASPDFIARASKYVTEQLQGVITFLEDFTGRPYNYDGLQEATENTRRMYQAWFDLLDMRQAIPSPITIWDLIMDHLMAAFVLRGYSWGGEVFDFSKGVMAKRVEQGIGAVPNEKYRLHWNGLGIWFEVGHYARKLAAYGATLLTSTYEVANPFNELDPNRPLESMADVLLKMYFNVGTRKKIDCVVDAVKKYSVNGILMQWSRSCNAYTIGLHDILEGVEKRTGVPGVLFQGECCDTRMFSEAEVDSHIDAFMEVLASRK